MMMPAFPLPLVRAMLRPFYRVAFHHRLPWPVQRALVDAVAVVQPLPAKTSRRRVTLGGRPAERVSVGPAKGAGTVLYLHGGGYTVGSIATHRSLAAHLSAETGRPVYLLDYRLAPENPFPAALQDAISAFEALAEGSDHAAGPIAVAGDSAGGGIALAAAQWLTARGTHTPAALALLSPWVNPGVVAERHRDLVVNRPWGLACAAAYLGDGDPADPRYAPLLGRLDGLPPTYLFVGTGELLQPQCSELATALRGAGVSVRYVESPVLWHAAQAQAGLVKQAAASLADISRFLAPIW